MLEVSIRKLVECRVSDFERASLERTAVRFGREELLQRQATALNNRGVTLFNKHKYAKR
jgi:hypothetical protein